MCRRISCSTCGKPTYAGCGAHIEQVLADVPEAKRCQCRQKPVTSAPTAQTTPWWSFGRKTQGK